MHDSVRLDHCWLIWHSPNTAFCGPGTCRSPVMCPCTPACLCRNHRFLESLNCHACWRGWRPHQQSGLLLQTLPGEQNTWNPVCSESCSHAHQLAHCLTAFWFPGFPVPSLQMHSSLFWSTLIKTALHSHWWRQTLCQSFNERAACEWLTGFFAVDKLPVLGLFLEQPTYYLM